MVWLAPLEAGKVMFFVTKNLNRSPNLDIFIKRRINKWQICIFQNFLVDDNFKHPSTSHEVQNKMCLYCMSHFTNQHPFIVFPPAADR